MYIISEASSFTPEDAFVGYQSDTPASIVFTVQQELKVKLSEDDDQWEKEVILMLSACDLMLPFVALLNVRICNNCTKLDSKLPL